MSFPSLKIGDLLIKTPIIQGGMGIGVSLSGLASAVAKYGGMGVIAANGIAITEPDQSSNYVEASNRALKKQIQAVREATDGPLGVNIMVALTNYADLVKVAIREGVDAIITGAGLPLNLPEYVSEVSESSKTKLIPIVSSARAAVIIGKKWLSRFNLAPDAFVVEGPRAGGHLGFKPEQLDDPAHALEKLIPEVIEGVKSLEDKAGKQIPVIAAGGVFSGADIFKFLKMGAAGVQMGTRFVATHECDASQAFKQAYVDSTEEDIVVIQSPVGLPGRAIKNSFLDSIKEGKFKPAICPFNCVHSCDHTKAPYCISAALINAMKGKLKYGFAFAGANAFLVDAIVSVKELMSSLEREYDQASVTATRFLQTHS